ncbi:HD domain-containing phosphohydrolase [Massilia sp. 2TAF26]|uniref:HD domain-containing phosphohydrolase n=1 Tax=Massilia sp. 2TAF26 TaxID=3233012 RepID=UPI003F94C8DC
MSAIAAVGSDTPAATILCVDDEPNILAALRRLFRKESFRVLCAESAAAGVAVLEQERVDIVISDMQMPEMNGTEFLECVRRRWPDTLRLLLTGHADVESTISAINRGEIYRYITKPWNESALLLVIRDALERQRLEREKLRLEVLTRQQNDALRDLNATLEQRVRDRTAELSAAQNSLQASHERLKSNFLTLIKVLSSLIEMRGGAVAGHGRRIADLARRIALRMGLTPREAQDVFVAGLLHEIGKTGFPDSLLGMPESMLRGDNLGRYRKYPLLGEQLLMPLEELREVAAIVRAHRERFDGSGFPDGVAGFDIPLAARILAVAHDFEALQQGLLVQQQMDARRATDLVVESRGKRYDPGVVGAFYDIRTGRSISEEVAEIAMGITQLKPGMVLSRDLLSAEGALLLSTDHVLSERMLKQLAEFEHRAGTELQLFIRSGAAHAPYSDS